MLSRSLYCFEDSLLEIEAERERERERAREMTKFSIGGEDDGGGPSSRRQKRQKASPRTIFSEETLEDEEGGGGGETDGEEERSDGDEETEEENEGGGGGGSWAGPRRDGSISVTLTDPEALDCSICYESLTIPVFQCENGHIACSTCCIKLGNKCPSCFLPIGYSRCRAIERVLESVKVSCQNSKYGCKEKVSYSKKCDHEKMCIYGPCPCPLSDCNYTSSSKRLRLHLHFKHKSSAISFLYNSSLSIILSNNERFLVLREVEDDVLFILTNSSEPLGNVVKVSCIGPSSKGGFFYDLLAKTKESTLRLRSFTSTIQKQVDNPPLPGFLVVPSYFFGSSGQLTLDLCISHGVTGPE